MLKYLDKNQILQYSSRTTELVLFDEIDSTSNFAKTAIYNGAKQGFVCVSNSQTAGRGRHGRTFYSPKDSGIYMSIVVNKDIVVENITLVTLASAVAVVDAIETMLNCDVSIKWINDIYKDNKKCAGILTEGVFGTDGKLMGIVVGIGVNLNTTFPAELSEKAGNIGMLDKNKFVALVCDNIIEYCNSSFDSWFNKYKSKCFILGKKVEVSNFNGEKFFAKATDIDNNGRLIVEKNGISIVLSNEEVSVATAEKYDF